MKVCLSFSSAHQARLDILSGEVNPHECAELITYEQLTPALLKAIAQALQEYAEKCEGNYVCTNSDASS